MIKTSKTALGKDEFGCKQNICFYCCFFGVGVDVGVGVGAWMCFCFFVLFLFYLS